MNDILCGDSASVLKYLQDESVHLTVTSPPYDKVRKYRGFLLDLETITAELFRVTSPGGVLVWVVGDQTIDGDETGTSFRHALRLKECGFKLFDTMIYRKTNPTPKNHRRYEQAFEYMFVFTKGRPNVFNPLTEPCKYAGKVCCSRFRNAGRDDLSDKSNPGKKISDHKVRTNIWDYHVGTVGDHQGPLFKSKHPAKFPYDLPKDHILTWTNPGDIVLDPFAGSGMTLLAAKNLGRRFMGIDISPEYCQEIRANLEAYETSS